MATPTIEAPKKGIDYIINSKRIYPDWIKTHQVFKNLNSIEKVFPRIGLLNFKEPCEIMNSEEAAKAATATAKTDAATAKTATAATKTVATTASTDAVTTQTASDTAVTDVGLLSTATVSADITSGTAALTNDLTIRTDKAKCATQSVMNAGLVAALALVNADTILPP